MPGPLACSCLRVLGEYTPGEPRTYEAYDWHGIHVAVITVTSLVSCDSREAAGDVDPPGRGFQPEAGVFVVVVTCLPDNDWQPEHGRYKR